MQEEADLSERASEVAHPPSSRMRPSGRSSHNVRADRSFAMRRQASPFLPQREDLSHLGSGERNCHGKGPRGRASGRERVTGRERRSFYAFPQFNGTVRANYRSRQTLTFGASEARRRGRENTSKRFPQFTEVGRSVAHDQLRAMLSSPDDEGMKTRDEQIGSHFRGARIVGDRFAGIAPTYEHQVGRFTIEKKRQAVLLAQEQQLRIPRKPCIFSIRFWPMTGTDATIFSPQLQLSSKRSGTTNTPAQWDIDLGNASESIPKVRCACP